jgi:eukaryotic-like serine/threonine-protein kinase
MTLTAGTRLGPYEITAQIGVGGMGEVYRAADTNLKRQVAIKVLPAALAADPERIARFQREAEVLASLNHHNIAQIHGFERSDGMTALVMELVDGPTLVGRIAEGPVPLDEAVRIATQIAEALEAAHERGIIHRDLKPANVKLRSDGAVKVLDFGLAKAMEPAGAAGANVSNSPTISMDATQRGVILGTAAYMSPEQARGKPADKRTDIWALGCVFYEMLTGQQAFPGDNVQEIIAGVLKSEPAWDALPESTPPGIRALLRRCLQKDVKHRLRDAADVQIQMHDALTALPGPSVSVPAAPLWRRPLPLLFTAVVSVIIGSTASLALRPSPTTFPSHVERLTIGVGPDSVLNLTAPENVALSPDGTHLVYAGVDGGTFRLYLRPMDSLEGRPLSGTENGHTPFFSPDGQWVGFFAGSDLKKAPIVGGAVLNLTSSGFGPVQRGATWGANDTIVFAAGNRNPLWRVPAAGGDRQQVTKLRQGEFTHRWPQFLPDGKTLLFTVGMTNSTTVDDAAIALLRPGATEHEILIRGGTYPRYVPTGHLVYYRAGTIMAVPFDLDRLQLLGSPAPVQEGVMSSAGGAGGALFSVSERGTLVYVPGGPQQGEFKLAWVDRNGKEQDIPDSRVDNTVRLSPDGQRAALVLENDIWVYDLYRGTLTRLTFEGNNAGPNWSPDSKRIVFRSIRGEQGEQIIWKLADGTGSEEVLLHGQYLERPGSFTPDGKTLLYAEVTPKTGSDLWVLPLAGERKPHPYLSTPFNEDTVRLSPDGRWVAYVSDESGRYEIYVRPFPDANGGKWQITTDGGQEIAWAPGGTELFYRAGSARERMMVVDIQSQPTFMPGRPRLLFAAPYFSRVATGSDYGVSPDGQRFLMIKAPARGVTSASQQLNVVLNWFEDVKRVAPTR